MTREITGYDENKQIEDTSAAPLCLVHYFVEGLAYPPERNPKPPGRSPKGRVVERDGNLLILEFAPPPETVQEKWQKKRQAERVQSRSMSRFLLLLLLVSALACLAAARF